jgi:N-acyl-D-aspartate/D-glutamate deacylase
MNLMEVAEKTSKDPWDAAYDLFKDEGLDLVEIGVAIRGHKEEDLCIGFKHTACMPNTDSWFRAPYGWLGKMSPHPRDYDGMVIVLRKWVRGVTRFDMPEEIGIKVVTLEEAVRKMTSLPAQRLGLKARGLLREACGRISSSSTTRKLRTKRLIQVQRTGNHTCIQRVFHTYLSTEPSS